MIIEWKYDGNRVEIYSAALACLPQAGEISKRNTIEI
jgi:hypothetical protein